MSAVYRKPRILFFSEAVTFAHVARPFLLASGLDSESFEIHFASSDNFSFLLKDASFHRWVVDSISPKDFQSILDRGGILFPQDKVARYVVEELRIIEKVQPDIIVGDLRVSLGVSAPFSRIPYLALTNAYWSPYSMDQRFPVPNSRVFQPLSARTKPRPLQKALATTIFHSLTKRMAVQQAKGLDAVRRLYGLPPFSDYQSGFTYGDRTLFADVPSLAPTYGLPATHRYIGPLCWSPKTELPAWWSDIKNDRPIVYLSLGSSGQWNLLPRLVEGLRGIDATIVIATGEQVVPDVRGENIFTAPYLPGEIIARRASLVVTNGGSPSTYQALREGVPVLMIPSNMDQLLCSTRVAQARCGLMLRSDEVSAPRVAVLVKELISRGHFRNNAQRISRELVEHRPEVEFLRVLQELLPEADRRPVQKVGNQ